MWQCTKPNARKEERSANAIVGRKKVSLAAVYIRYEFSKAFIAIIFNSFAFTKLIWFAIYLCGGACFQLFFFQLIHMCLH